MASVKILNHMEQHGKALPSRPFYSYYMPPPEPTKKPYIWLHRILIGIEQMEKAERELHA